MNRVVKTVVSAVPAIVMTGTLQAEPAANPATPAGTQPATQPATAPAIAQVAQTNEPLVIPDGTSLQNPGPADRGFRMLEPGTYTGETTVTLGVRG